jgi:Zn-dependent M28 family amino/carboxypeptidase
VVFIAFSGEELGLLGSAYYVKQPIYPLAGTLAMVNLDMVGRLRNGRLIVYGARSAKEFPALLDSLNWYAGFDLKAQGDGYVPQRSRCCTSSPICTRTITGLRTTGRR